MRLLVWSALRLAWQLPHFQYLQSYPFNMVLVETQDKPEKDWIVLCKISTLGFILDSRFLISLINIPDWGFCVGTYGWSSMSFKEYKRSKSYNAVA